MLVAALRRDPPGGRQQHESSNLYEVISRLFLRHDTGSWYGGCTKAPLMEEMILIGAGIQKPDPLAKGPKRLNIMAFIRALIRTLLGIY